MLTRVDRIQVAVPDRQVAAHRWHTLLGAAPDGDDRLDGLAAHRSVWRLGTGRVEFLEPDGAGPVADALGRRGPHLFAAGVATPDLTALAERLRAKGVHVVADGADLYLHEAGAPIVVGTDQEADVVGDVDFLYEVTDLRRDAAGWTVRYADWFQLQISAFHPISSDRYGYTGTLTLFDPDRLDRLEVITPNDPDKTMGRYFDKHGDALYMAFAESPAIPTILERCLEHEAPHTADGEGPHTLFLHPRALGGVMLGLSAPTRAWMWSGHPERVRTA